MLETNLLPESERKFLRTEKLFRTVVFAFILVIVTLVAVSGFFWAMQQLIDIKQDATSRQLASMQASVQESAEGQAQEKINQLNQAVNTQAKLIANQPQWTPLIEKLLAVTPGGIILNELIGDSEEMTLKISGQAQTRQQLIDFQDTLEGMDFTESLDAPLSNIIEKESVPFDMTVTLKKDSLHTSDAQGN